ncbi:hypothetical protein [Blastococcus haudaquaticus]|uniref:Uncharacterized protein n=1 Tax=Blastococcus haudaquaticus TaxID=1938745 RepID=A0A286GIW6_9ACTN|nr:hypothetical protein [Blastococcus haudaquaticus]SOD95422.1 hypothetical protein SAMN06272739_1206 [Blastococcus haudaquaticus]
MRRQRLSVTVPVPGRDGPQAAELMTTAVERARRRPREVGDLVVRARPDGDVRVRRVSHRYVTFPLLDGQLERSPDGSVGLVGTVVENAMSLFWVGLYAVVVVVLLAGAGGAALNGEWGGVALCLPAAGLFALLTRSFRRARRTFPADAADLLAVLGRTLRA